MVEATISVSQQYREYIATVTCEILMENNLQNIIKACLKRDRKSQNALYRLYYSYGMSIAIRYIHDERIAIEIVNDSFMKVFKYLKKYNPENDFKPWFRRIVVNAAIDKIKEQKKLQMNTDLREAENVTAKDEILSKIGYKELLILVEQLSTAYKAVFNMYVIDGFKHEEIAKSLNISVGTSKSNLSKARAALKKLISEQLNTKYA